MDKRKTFMDVNQTLDLVSALSEAECDGGEGSGLSDVSWVDSASDGVKWNQILTYVISVQTALTG